MKVEDVYRPPKTRETAEPKRDRGSWAVFIGLISGQAFLHAAWDRGSWSLACIGFAMLALMFYGFYLLTRKK